MSADMKRLASASILGKMVAGLSADPQWSEQLGADGFETEGARVGGTIVHPSGDRYRVTVEWLSEDSP